MFAGRFVGILRALVPAIAGTTRMPYRTFVAYNAPAGIIWTSGFVLAGYLAGNSYERVASVAGRAGLLLLIVIVVAVAIVLAARWAARHRERVTAPLGRLWRTPRVQDLASRATRLAVRWSPGSVLGLLLLAQLVLLVALGAAFGAVLEDVVEGDELATIDAPVATFVIEHREPWLTGVFEVLTWAGSGLVLVPLLLGTGLVLWRVTRSPRALLFLAACLAGASALSNLIKLAVARPRPDDALIDAIGYAFPSGHATNAAACWLALALALGGLTASWPRRVALVTAAVLIAAARRAVARLPARPRGDRRARRLGARRAVGRRGRRDERAARVAAASDTGCCIHGGRVRASATTSARHACATASRSDRSRSAPARRRRRSAASSRAGVAELRALHAAAAVPRRAAAARDRAAGARRRPRRPRARPRPDPRAAPGGVGVLEPRRHDARDRGRQGAGTRAVMTGERRGADGATRAPAPTPAACGLAVALSIRPRSRPMDERQTRGRLESSSTLKCSWSSGMRQRRTAPQGARLRATEPQHVSAAIGAVENRQR